MWAVMPDLLVAIVILSLFLLLAVAAPIWGVDSRDGIRSNEYARRALWLYDRRPDTSGTTIVGSDSRGTGLETGAPLRMRGAAVLVATIGPCLAAEPEAAY
jgi:hypothetical protein